MTANREFFKVSQNYLKLNHEKSNTHTESRFTLTSGIILEGAMGKIARNFSKWPLNFEIMGQFYNVRV